MFEADFQAWLALAARGTQPSSSVVAFNIGLLETPDGYSAYLIGANRYDDQGDWACYETFAPEERFFALPPNEFNGQPWEAVQSRVIRAVKCFLASPEGQASFLATAKAVTVGFDDGDLTRIA
jgi:hypothetical protein